LGGHHPVSTKRSRRKRGGGEDFQNSTLEKGEKKKSGPQMSLRVRGAEELRKDKGCKEKKKKERSKNPKKKKKKILPLKLF